MFNFCRKRSLLIILLTFFLLGTLSGAILAYAPLFEYDNEQPESPVGDGNIGGGGSFITGPIFSAKNGSEIVLNPTVKAIYAEGIVFEILDSVLNINHALKIINYSNATYGAIRITGNAGSSASANIGDDLTLNIAVGKDKSAQGITAKGNGGTSTVIVGNNLRIAMTGGGLNSALGVEFSGNNSKATIKVGDNSYLSVTNPGAFGFSGVISTNSWNNGTTAEIEVGKNSTIIMADQNSYAIVSFAGANTANVSLITIGSGANITVEGANSSALYFNQNGHIILDEGAKIEVEGENSSVFYFEKPKYDKFSFKNISASAIKDSSGEYTSLIDAKKANKAIAVTFDGNSDVFGNVVTNTTTGQISIFLKDNSHWAGSFSGATNNIDLSGTSTWTLLADNNVEKMTMKDNSSVIFAGTPYLTLNVNNLSAADNSVIKMRVMIDDGDPSNSDNDLLVIANGTGQLFFDFSMIAENGLRSGKVISVSGGDIIIPESVGIGVNLYNLVSEDESGATAYYLEKTNDINPIIGTISAGSIGMIQSAKALDDTIASYADRRTKGFFTQGYYKRQVYDKLELEFNTDIFKTPSFKQNIGGAVVGYNWGNNDNALLGVFIGYSNTTMMFDDAFENTPNMFSSSEIQILTGGIQTMLKTRGFYLHAYARIAYNSQESRLLTAQEGYYNYGRTDALGVSASASIAYPFVFKNTNLSIVPVGRVFFTHIGAHDFYVYSDDMQNPDLKLVSAAESGFQTWLGAVVNQAFNFTNGMRLDVNLGAGWVYNDGHTVAISLGENTFTTAIDRHLLSIKLGLDLDIGNQYVNGVFLDLDFMIGKTMKEVVGIKAGATWVF